MCNIKLVLHGGIKKGCMSTLETIRLYSDTPSSVMKKSSRGQLQSLGVLDTGNINWVGGNIYFHYS